MKKKTALLLSILSCVCLCGGVVSCGVTEHIRVEKGDKGDKGDQGAQGIPGETPYIKDGYWWIGNTNTNVKAEGQDGEDGVAPDIKIGENGNWFINGIDTGVKATGSDGEKGDKGDQGEQGVPGETPYIKDGYWWIGDTNTNVKAEGEDGKTPDIKIGENGNWFINGIDTGVKASGEDGEKGDKGDQGEQGVPGETPYIKDGYWWIGDTNTNVKAEGEDGKTPEITIGENGNWFINGVDTGVKATGSDGEKGDQGEKGETAWSNTILPSTGGYVLPSVGSGLVGDDITFTAIALDGYVLKDWDISSVDDHFEGQTSVTLKMIAGGYVVKANFEKDETILISDEDLLDGVVDLDPATVLEGSTCLFRLPSELPENALLPTFNLNGANPKSIIVKGTSQKEGRPTLIVKDSYIVQNDASFKIDNINLKAVVSNPENTQHPESLFTVLNSGDSTNFVLENSTITATNHSYINGLMYTTNGNVQLKNVELDATDGYGFDTIVSFINGNPEDGVEHMVFDNVKTLAPLTGQAFQLQQFKDGAILDVTNCNITTDSSSGFFMADHSVKGEDTPYTSTINVNVSDSVFSTTGYSTSLFSMARWGHQGDDGFVYTNSKDSWTKTTLSVNNVKFGELGSEVLMDESNYTTNIETKDGINTATASQHGLVYVNDYEWKPSESYKSVNLDTETYPNAIINSQKIEDKATLIKVEEPEVPNPTEIIISGEKTVEAGSSILLTATTNPEGSDSSVIWTSSNPEVATIDEMTGELTGVKAGTVTITATSTVVPSLTATVEITVTAKAQEPIVLSYEKGWTESTELTGNIYATDLNVDTAKMVVDPEGKIINSFTTIAKVYKDSTLGGMKFSSGSANGSLAFTTTSAVKNITIKAVAWSSSKDSAKINVNGTTYEFANNTGKLADAEEFTFDFTEATNSISIKATKRFVIIGMTFTLA